MSSEDQSEVSADLTSTMDQAGTGVPLSQQTVSQRAISESEGGSTCASFDGNQFSAAQSKRGSRQVFYTPGGLPEFTCVRTVGTTPNADGHFECEWKIAHVPLDYAVVVSLVGLWALCL